MRINLPFMFVIFCLIALWSFALVHIARHLHDAANVIHFAGSH